MSSYFSIDKPSFNRVIHIICLADFPSLYKYREGLKFFQVSDRHWILFRLFFFFRSAPDTVQDRLREEPPSDILKPHTRQIRRGELKNVKIVRHAYKPKKILEN